MELLIKIVIWLFFWPVILLGYLAFWLIFVIEVPWEVLGVLYALAVMGFFGFLLWLDRRDSGAGFSRKTKLLWLIAALLTAVSVLLLILLCGYFGDDSPGLSMICGAYAMMAPILSGCFCVLAGFLKE
ncbi:MAG: hypothetical protein IJF78_15690 [Clostridia bacterium]|nr:hypothetical protein [Clostridia bacterium]